MNDGPDCMADAEDVIRELRQQLAEKHDRITLLEGLVQEMMFAIEMFAPGSKLLTHATKVMEAK